MVPLQLDKQLPRETRKQVVFVDQQLDFDFLGDSGKTYHMTVGHLFCWCSCPGFNRYRHCKHQRRAQAWLQQEGIRFELSQEHLDSLFASFETCAQAVL